MAKFGRLFLVTMLLLGLLLSASVAVTGCGEETKTTTGATATAAKDSSLVIGDRALKTLASTPASGEYANNVISGAELAKKLADPAEKAKLYLLDIRKKADYDKAHIEGSSQVEFAQWAANDNISKLPKDKKIIVICYTGNTAAQTVSGLRMLGYDAAALKAGMNGWAQTGLTETVVADLEAAAYPVVTTPAGSSAAAPAAAAFDKPAGDDMKALSDKASKIMSSMPADGDYALNTITPAKLSEKLGGADKDKLFVIDIRKTEDFNKGHIDGATHIDFLAVAVPDNLKMLPKDKKIVVVCYTGNTAAQATTILRMLDYDAVVLKFGMMGWSGNGKDAYISEIQAADNPTVSS